MKRGRAAAAASSLAPQRGSLVALKRSLNGGCPLAVIISNDIQNEVSEFLLAIPLERRSSRLRAPFAVDLGRSDGLRELHTARADWLTRIHISDISRIERASFSPPTIQRLEEALRAALSLP